MSMRLFLILSLSLAAAFSPRNGFENRGAVSLEKLDQTLPSQQNPVPEINRPPATIVTLSEDWTSANTTETSSRTLPAHFQGNEQSKYFLNLPIEKDSELKTDQNNLAAVLKEPIIEISSVFLVVLSSFLVALSTVNSIDLKTIANIIRTENAIACIFAFEFFTRWYSQFTWKGAIDYMFQPLVVVDLVVVILPLIPLLVPPASAGVYDILPSWLFSSAGLVNLRLLRVLRLQRVLTSMDTFADFQMALGIPRTEVKPYKLELARVVLSLFTLLSISTGLIYSAENTANPDIPSYFDALYFTLTTLTTVGFGDIVPVTPEGKLVVSGSILAGVAIIPAQAAALVEALLARAKYKAGDATPAKQNAGIAAKEDGRSLVMQMTSCPNCSAEHHWATAEFCWSCGTKLDNSRRE
jgi:voltage-gated potassium channel